MTRSETLTPIKIKQKITPNCGICKFAHFSTPLGTLLKINCRRYPPQVNINETDDDYYETTIWPLVEQNQWCGEFEMATPRLR